MMSTRESQPRGTWRRVAVIIVSVVLFAPAGCNAGNNPDPDPTRMPTATAPPSPTQTAEPWEADFTADELDAYRAALDHVEEFRTLSQPIYAAGQATAEARELFQEYFSTWQYQFGVLEDYELQGITIARRPEALWSRPESVDLEDDGTARVVIVQCIEQSDLGAELDGEPLPSAYDEPVLLEVDVALQEGSWRIGLFDTTGEPCDP